MVFKFFPLIFAVIGYFEPWGKDADVRLSTPTEEFLTPNLLSASMQKVILFHQNVLSTVDGPRSHFRPTSARYMYLAIRRYGFFKGYTMGCDRLLRENNDPWVYRTRIIDGVQWKWDPPLRSILPKNLAHGDDLQVKR